MSFVRSAYPLGRAFGLIEGDVNSACEVLLREIKRSFNDEAGIVSVVSSFVGVEKGLSLLDPVVTPFEDRYLIMACPGAWSLYLDNSALFDGSPPRLADLARHQSKQTIHVTSTPSTPPEPSPVQQISIYQKGGGMLRSICNQWDRSVWRFTAEGTPYAFETPYRAADAERFTREHIRRFLAQLGVAVAAGDDLLRFDANTSGFLLEYKEQNPDFVYRKKYTSLEELRRV
jgi:hypothetical protein